MTISERPRTLPRCDGVHDSPMSEVPRSDRLVAVLPQAARVPSQPKFSEHDVICNCLMPRSG